MRLLGDENLACATRLFSPLGELRLLPGRRIAREDVTHCDALLLRSVTKVTAELIRNSGLRFVGTATIGTDHIDLQALRDAGIVFAAAPGCNAEAVADYVLSAVAHWCEAKSRRLELLRIGLIGCGHVGQAVERRFSALGCEVLVYDPPRAQRGELASIRFANLFDCDVVSLHVPLSQHGPHATRGMIAQRELQQMQAGQCLINAARGGVIDEKALKARLAQPDAPDAILDTWENEPEIDAELLARCFLATPHIAGYSEQGRIRGSWMIYQALCRFTGRPVEQTLTELLPPCQAMPSSLHTLEQALKTAYNIVEDDRKLRELVKCPGGFDRLRRYYPMRREFSSLQITSADPSIKAAGFTAL
jgi:erythronate-4-phosphate dehydrogenase